MALSSREGLFFEPLEFSLPPALDDPESCARLLSLYRACERTTSLHGAFIDVNPASGDAAFAELSRRRCRESCRLAAELGAGEVVFHASAHPFLRGTYLQTWAGRCADFYAELSETYGLGIRVENSQDVDCVPLQKMMNCVRGGDVAVCLDIGHAQYSSAPLEEWFDRLGGHIAYLHLSDNMGRFDDHLPIGSGVIDWCAADRLWRELDRKTCITLEVGGIEGVDQSVRYLRQHGYFGA